MSIIKTEYSTNFEIAPVTSSDEAERLFISYVDEFLSEDSTIIEFVAMCLNIINDFLESKIDERTLGMLSHRSLVEPSTKHFYAEPYLWEYNDILALMNEIMDIDWTKGGSSYQEYLTELKSRWLDLVQKYSHQDK